MSNIRNYLISGTMILIFLVITLLIQTQRVNADTCTYYPSGGCAFAGWCPGPGGPITDTACNAGCPSSVGTGTFSGKSGWGCPGTCSGVCVRSY